MSCSAAVRCHSGKLMTTTLKNTCDTRFLNVMPARRLRLLRAHFIFTQRDGVSAMVRQNPIKYIIAQKAEIRNR